MYFKLTGFQGKKDYIIKLDIHLLVIESKEKKSQNLIGKVKHLNGYLEPLILHYSYLLSIQE